MAWVGGGTIKIKLIENRENDVKNYRILQKSMTSYLYPHTPHKFKKKPSSAIICKTDQIK